MILKSDQHPPYSPLDPSHTSKYESSISKPKLFLLIIGLLSLLLCVSKSTNFSSLGSIRLVEYINFFTINFKYSVIYQKYRISFNKTYSKIEEYERLQYFVQNMKNIEELYSISDPSVEYGFNEFTDWSEKELKSLTMDHEYNVKMLDMVIGATPNYDKDFHRPKSFDWNIQGKVTPIKNQGQCGSCWAFAAVAVVETHHAIKSGNLQSLSEQQLIDCDKNSNGCHGGIVFSALRMSMRSGLLSESDYPYEGTDSKNCKEQSGARVRINNVQMMPQDEEKIADWISSKGPVTIGMNVTKGMYSYRSGIFHPSKEECQNESVGSHALVLTGYGTTSEGTDYWIVKNSWGSSWGLSGYFWLKRGVNSCGLANRALSPVIN